MGNLGSKQSRKSSGKSRGSSSETSDPPRSGTVVSSDDGPAAQIANAHRSRSASRSCEDIPNFETENTENVDQSNVNANAEGGASSSARIKGDLNKKSSWKKVKNHKSMAERKRQLRSRTANSIKLAAHMTLRGSVQEFDRVALPEGENLNEWLAFHTLHFFEAAILMNGTLQEACTKESCPQMNAGPKYKYLWADGSRVKDPIDVSAPEYITFMFAWIDEQVNDTKIFPEDEDVKFPRNFKSVVRKIFSRLFRLYAHIYRNHMKDVTAVGAEAHLNSCFRHFIQFVKEFKLLQEKEMKPLANVMRTLEKQEQERKSLTDVMHNMNLEEQERLEKAAEPETEDAANAAVTA